MHLKYKMSTYMGFTYYKSLISVLPEANFIKDLFLLILWFIISVDKGKKSN